MKLFMGDVKTIKTESRNRKTTKVKIAEVLRIKHKLIQLVLKLCTAAKVIATKYRLFARRQNSKTAGVKQHKQY